MGRTKQSSTSSTAAAAATKKAALAALREVTNDAPFTFLMDIMKKFYPSHPIPNCARFCEVNPGASVGAGVGPHLSEAPDEILAALYDAILYGAPAADCKGVIHVSGRPVIEGEEHIIYEAETTLVAQKALMFRFIACSHEDFYEVALAEWRDGDSIFFDEFGEDPDVEAVAEHFCITVAQAERILTNSLKEGAARAERAADALMEEVDDEVHCRKIYNSLIAGSMTFEEAVDAVKSEEKAADLKRVFLWAEGAIARYMDSPFYYPPAKRPRVQ